MPTPPLDSPLAFALLFGVGLVAGTVNVVAGGGSFLTLPAMIFLGLPPTVANGTNRVAILVQNVGAVWGFGRHDLVRRSWLRTAALPAVAGAVAGTWAALQIGETAFQRILAMLMVAAALWILWDPLGGLDAGEEEAAAGGESAAEGPECAAEGPHGEAASPPVRERAPMATGPGFLLAFFLVGFYGGFVQAGVGFFILAVATVAGLDLVRGNALKVLITLVWTPVSLAIFAWGGKVAWGMGLALAAGNLAGGLLGVRLTVLKGHDWLKRAVTVLVLALAVKLLMEG